ncbi:MAG: glutamate--tRNA ligase [Rhodospirillaceae bacterium]|jgi:glutamyl-tRNA synthetase|nr:glutamate--tRNA ligase [Rhodospirillaceae bacterium]MBT5659712.1 glutamate--tRNA ligase [Rhodospirillaceae bacterium]
MTVVTRFAPSPTGFLHIGGARTALFNQLFARHHGGRYLLRIEDTDRKRSTEEAIDAILDGLDWLGLGADEAPVFQSKNAGRHAAIANELLANGKAYHCYSSPDELQAMREAAKAEGKPMRYDGTWRDRNPEEAPEGISPVVRFKAPQTGETVINDHVQGEVKITNDQLDDMILLRADGTPTYMLSVVVDDHDMGITHVIRGDDHLTNAFRQTQLYLAMDWIVPEFGHIPLIHGADGAKLSKRHGALGVDAYRDMGYLPEALRNYLLRLGWGHGDDETISDQQAVEWFDLKGVGRAPSRFDFAKLENLNGHYMRQADDARLVDLITPGIAERLGCPVNEIKDTLLKVAMEGLKQRAKNINELTDNALFYVKSRPLTLDDQAAGLLDAPARAMVAELASLLEACGEWSAEPLEEIVRTYAEKSEIKLGKVAQPLRAALTGSKTSPPIFEVMAVLGREESLGRISDVTKNST